MVILVWKTKEKDIKISNLKELFDVLIDIKQEDIDKVMGANLKNLIKWLESEFPNQVELIIHLKGDKGFTLQQIREQMIRDLRTLKL